MAKITICFEDVQNGEEFVSMVTGVGYRKGSVKQGCNAQVVFDDRDVIINDKLEVQVEREPIKQ